MKASRAATKSVSAKRVGARRLARMERRMVEAVDLRCKLQPSAQCLEAVVERWQGWVEPVQKFAGVKSVEDIFTVQNSQEATVLEMLQCSNAQLLEMLKRRRYCARNAEDAADAEDAWNDRKILTWKEVAYLLYSNVVLISVILPEYISPSRSPET